MGAGVGEGAVAAQMLALDAGRDRRADCRLGSSCTRRCGHKAPKLKTVLLSKMRV